MIKVEVIQTHIQVDVVVGTQDHTQLRVRLCDQRVSSIYRVVVLFSVLNNIPYQDNRLFVLVCQSDDDVPFIGSTMYVCNSQSIHIDFKINFLNLESIFFFFIWTQVVYVLIIECNCTCLGESPLKIPDIISNICSRNEAQILLSLFVNVDVVEKYKFTNFVDENNISIVGDMDP